MNSDSLNKGSMLTENSDSLKGSMLTENSDSLKGSMLPENSDSLKGSMHEDSATTDGKGSLHPCWRLSISRIKQNK